ncbi:uncharacterized protein LOC130739706 [Lotus japonicus]|uniref:uncharacterized protein LOC130739706 n=1 Tax=Lotus japonicus TaxID=34305 RepID=UPI0025853437|nr:uncharacterized protein LOC130739706 [Lotus japonicus]
MMEKGVSREHFRPRTCSGKKSAPETSQVKKEGLKNVIYIDVDNDQVDDVVILESPEFVSRKVRGSCGPSRERTFTPQSVISIDTDDDDDDDDDGGSDGADRRGNGDAEGGGELDSDATSSKRHSSSSSSEQNSLHNDVDDSRNAYKKESVSNMDRRKKSFFGEDAGGSRYGLYGSESESSDSDCSDCEFMDRDEWEKWEKVSAKRKRGVSNNQTCQEEHAGPSRCHNNVYIDIDEENTYEQHAEVPVYPGPSNGKYVKESQPSFSARDDSQVPRCPKEKNCNFCNSVAGPSKFKENQPSFSYKDGSQVNGIYFNVETKTSFKDSDQKAEQSSKSPRSESVKEMHSFRQSFDVKNQCSDIKNGERTREEKVSPSPKGKNSDYFSGASGASSFKKDLSVEESKSMGFSPNACEMQVDNNESALGSKDAGFQKDMGDLSFKKDLGVEESKSMGFSPNACEMQVDNNESALESKEASLAEVYSICASIDERHVNGNGLVLHGQDGGLTASNERNIINEKEKLKETDEYKQAVEEEWASRQRQLQIQAEEAQRLRKRKKAESQRILDMQRRQKERIEEVRETQKKDEEFLNMKEQLRVEIRKRLNQLEMRCSDMTSLLRGLGIHVGGSFPKELHAAYKRALFKFHPDRASKTDIREQVEAEEKFKLISRLKDKYLLTPCR